MDKDEYIKESIEASLNDCGVVGKIASIILAKKILQIASDVALSLENYGMYAGYDCIPNPMIAEVNEQKKFRKQDEQGFNKRLDEKDKIIEDLRYSIENLRYKLEEARKENNLIRSSR